MPIQLDKILADVGKEKVLHPNFTGASKKDIDDAWVRVGESNKLSVHEARSIFKVLQKKYEQEKKKDNSSWKLYAAMHDIYQTTDAKSGTKQEPDMCVEDDEEYEMLDVQEEEDHSAQLASTHSSDNESAKSHTSPEKVARPPINAAPKRPSDEKKLLNTMASATPRPPLSSNATHGTSACSAMALQKKGITMKKTTTATPTSSTVTTTGAAAVKSPPIATAAIAVKSPPNPTPTNKPGFVKIMRNEIAKKVPENKKIQLPESIKRKLNEEEALSSTKKPRIAPMVTLPPKQTLLSQATHTTTNQLMQVKQELQIKQEIEDMPSSTAPPHGINVITIPATSTRSELTNGLGICGGGGGTSSTAATVASTSTNGDFSPRIEDFDFKTGIIFDPNAATTNGASPNKINSTGEIINLGNFDNSLPQTFFRNLCTSSRHEALGLYVANVMNRLPPRLASKLELSILRAIFDTRSEELEQ